MFDDNENTKYTIDGYDFDMKPFFSPDQTIFNLMKFSFTVD